MKLQCLCVVVLAWGIHGNAAQNYGLTQDSFNSLTLTLINELDQLIDAQKTEIFTFAELTKIQTASEITQIWQAYKDFFVAVRNYPIDAISSITSKEFDVSLMTLLMNTIYAYEGEIALFKMMTPEDLVKSKEHLAHRAQAVRQATALFNSFMSAAHQ